MATTHLNVAKDNSLTIFDSIYSINSVNFLFHVHSSLFAFFSKFIFHLLSMILNEKNVKQKFLFIFLYFWKRTSVENVYDVRVYWNK